MPSHPDRVRRNYHTITTQKINVPEHCAWHFNVMVSKLEVASWRSGANFAHEIATKVYKEALRAFGR